MAQQLYMTGKSARHLRGLGHHLSPLGMVGKEGITANLIDSLEQVLTSHELIKVKLQDGCPYGKTEAAEMLAQKTKSRIAQIIGRTILLFRPNPAFLPREPARAHSYGNP